MADRARGIQFFEDPQDTWERLGAADNDRVCLIEAISAFEENFKDFEMSEQTCLGKLEEVEAQLARLTDPDIDGSAEMARQLAETQTSFADFQLQITTLVRNSEEISCKWKSIAKREEAISVQFGGLISRMPL